MEGDPCGYVDGALKNELCGGDMVRKLHKENYFMLWIGCR